MRLSSPRFNLMGDPGDTRMMVEHVMKRFPDSEYLGMVGVSAGSGLLITYLGQEGDKTSVRAACSLCQAFQTLSQHFPLVDNHLLSSLKNLFIIKNHELLSEHYQNDVISCSEAKTVQQFFDAHHVFAWSDSMEDYYRDNNPMNWDDDIVRPTLIINSEDDMVCLPENIREDVVLEQKLDPRCFG